MNPKINFSPPDISDLEINEVVDTLKSGWLTTGPKTKLFEENLSNFCGTKRVACLSSATASLELILRILGIGKGDEVITTAYTYSSSCSVICHVGATPVLIDTDKNSFHLSYNQLEKNITEKTKAIIAVDIAGLMCDYKKIFQIVENKKNIFHPNNDLQEKIGRIAVIADSAHALGASQNGKMAGSVADFTAFSFHAVKNLTTAEGGAATWKNIKDVDNEDLYNKFMLLSLHGQSKDALSKNILGDWEYDILTPAYKCNMADITASLGLAQLKRYPELLKKRKMIIEYYNNTLNNEPITYLNHFTDNNISSGHLYLVRLNNKDESFRNKLIDQLFNAGVPTNVHYKPLPMLTAYKNLGFNINEFPNAFEMFKNEITLPLHTLLTLENIEYITTNFKKILNNQ